VTEQILNGRPISTQTGYTVPFTSVHAGQYGQRRPIKKHTLLKLSTTQKSKQHKT